MNETQGINEVKDQVNLESKEAEIPAAREENGRVSTYDYTENERKIGLTDIMQVGSKVVIGGGVGLLSGIAAVAIAASAAEIVIAGAVSKIAGAVGGAVGLSVGLNGVSRNGKGRKYDEKQG